MSTATVQHPNTLDSAAPIGRRPCQLLLLLLLLLPLLNLGTAKMHSSASSAIVAEQPEVCNCAVPGSRGRGGVEPTQVAQASNSTTHSSAATTTRTHCSSCRPVKYERKRNRAAPSLPPSLPHGGGHQPLAALSPSTHAQTCDSLSARRVSTFRQCVSLYAAGRPVSRCRPNS